MHTPPRQPAPPAVETVPNDRDRIESLAERLVGEAERMGYPRVSTFAIRLAFEEAITNAFEHGHRGIDAPVRVEYAFSPQHAWIAIEDQGPGFDPGTLADPRLDENLDKPGGRGVMLIRAYMSDVRFNAKGNRIEMRYDRPEPG
jgi:serine/threonine-protein kinase RsbW